MKISLAGTEDVATVVQILNEAADGLTQRFGEGHWSGQTTEKGVLFALHQKTKILLAFDDNQAVGTLGLGTQKPWVIDTSYFTPVRKPVYLTGMAVKPASQHKGIGRALIAYAVEVVREWPADAIRLDAYDAAAGAGDFYLKCGFKERGHVVYKTVPHIYFEWLL